MEKIDTRKKILDGVVTSDKMQKTIVVKMERKTFHPRYKKLVKHVKKVKAHDPDEVAKHGDRVRIIESRAYSKEKKFKLIEVVK